MAALALNAGAALVSVFMPSGTEGDDEALTSSSGESFDDEFDGRLSLDLLNDPDAMTPESADLAAQKSEWADALAEAEAEIAAENAADADIAEGDDDEDGFVLSSEFIDQPYSIVSGFNPDEDVIAVLYQSEIGADGTEMEPEMTVSQTADGNSSEIFLNGEPRGLIDGASELSMNDVKMMDVSEE